MSVAQFYSHFFDVILRLFGVILRPQVIFRLQKNIRAKKVTQKVSTFCNFPIDILYIWIIINIVIVITTAGKAD
jgi:hypothetical protein